MKLFLILCLFYSFSCFSFDCEEQKKAYATAYLKKEKARIRYEKIGKRYWKLFNIVKKTDLEWRKTPNGKEALTKINTEREKIKKQWIESPEGRKAVFEYHTAWLKYENAKTKWVKHKIFAFFKKKWKESPEGKKAAYKHSTAWFKYENAKKKWDRTPAGVKVWIKYEKTFEEAMNKYNQAREKWKKTPDGYKKTTAEHGRAWRKWNKAEAQWKEAEFNLKACGEIKSKMNKVLKSL